MKIVELTNQQFDEFAKFHALNNYCQTPKYALLMSEYGYNYDYIGYVDDAGNIKAASLILIRKITNHAKYGYAPKGFLINYYDKDLVQSFFDALREYYKGKDFIFIKFNPEIIIGQTTKARNFIVDYNNNVKVIDELKSMNVKRRLESFEFELMQPKFNAYVNLRQFDYKKLKRNYRKKIKHCLDYGMKLVTGSPKDIDIFYQFIKGKTKHPITYYRNYFNVFSRDNSIDLVLVQVDFERYLSAIREAHDKEARINDHYNEMIQTKVNQKTLNSKMNSDRKLQAYKEKIVKATNELKKQRTAFVGGALVIKHYNRVSILISGYSNEYAYLNPHHFLYYAIFERYKPYFNFCDMNGVTGVFDEKSKYNGLNKFKIDFNPTIYEFIGEFDLICSEHLFKRLIKTSFIEDEFINH